MVSDPVGSRSSAPDAATPWYVPIARSIPALIGAAAITFNADHSAALGLLAFGLLAAASGAVVLVAALRWARAGVERGVLVVQGTIGIVAGGASLAVPGAGLPYLVFLLTATSVVTGFLELYVGIRGRRADRFARDRLFLGGLTVVFAAAVLLVPPGFVLSFTGPDGVARALTGSIVVVGLLGAYQAILGIYLVIAGLSLKWGTELGALSTVKNRA